MRCAGYENPARFFMAKLVEGIATIAAAFSPRPVTLRLSDFKSDEYANLLGGERYEPPEANPMLGFRGVSRYLSPEFGSCFELECRAIRHVRDEMGLVNVEVMVPFVRTLDEARQVVARLSRHGLERGPKRPAPHHDVRGAVERRARLATSSSTSTGSRSDRTT